ncbi:MAG: MDR family MFS transporter [Aureliella sp.]
MFNLLRDYLELPLPVRILCFGSFVNRAGSFVVIFLSIYASEQLGFGVPFATACIGVLGFGSMLGSMAGGMLADRVGRRSVMLVALFGGATSLGLLSQVGNKWLFMLNVGLFAFVADLYRPAASAMIADLVDVSKRAHAFALMYISINLGFAIAPPVGGLLAGYSFQYLFWLDALTMTAFGAIICCLIPETLPKRTRDGLEVEDLHGDGPDGKLLANNANDGRHVSWRAAFSRMKSDRAFLLFCLSTLLIGIVFVQGFSTLPLHLRKMGCSNIEFGLLMSINGVLIFLMQLPMTHWLSRFNAMTMVLVGGILISIGFGLTAISGSIAFAGLCIAVWTIGEIFQAPFKQSIVSDMAPDEMRGNYMGLFTMCYATALTIGAPLGGEVLHSLGPTVLWSGVFVVALAAVAVYAGIHPVITRRIAAKPSL